MLKAGRIALRAVLILVALVVVGSAATLVVEEWKAGGDPPSIGRHLPITDTRNVTQIRSCEIGPSENSNLHAQLALTVERVDLRAATMTVGVRVCFPRFLLESLINGHGEHIFERYRSGNEESLLPKGGFGHTYVRITYNAEVPGGSSEFGLMSKEKPLGKLVEGDAPFEARELYVKSPYVWFGKLVLPMDAAPTRYPLDWYAVHGSLVVSIGGTLGLPPIEQGFASPDLPYDTQVLASPSISPLLVDASARRAPENGVLLREAHARQIDVRLVRSTATRTYVAVVAFIPLILGSLLCILLFRRGSGSKPRIGIEGLAGVAAVLLAVLPIRFVLVPATATELTLVDYWLGFEMAVLAAIACLAVARSV